MGHYHHHHYLQHFQLHSLDAIGIIDFDLEALDYEVESAADSDDDGNVSILACNPKTSSLIFLSLSALSVALLSLAWFSKPLKFTPDHWTSSLCVSFHCLT